MKSVFDLVARLPNEDIQIDRATKRRTYPCPSCGKNVRGCRAVRTSPEKPFDQLGILIPCPKCGSFTIEMCNDDHGDYEVVMETGKRYNMFSRVEAADACLSAFMDNPISRLEEGKPMLAELAYDFAEELCLAEEDDDALAPPYLLALRTYCELVRAGNREHAEPLARLILECGRIPEPDILDQLVIAYGLIEDLKADVPAAIYFKTMTSRALLECCSTGNEHHDDIGYLIEVIRGYADEFDALPKEEKAVSPYAAAEMWSFSLGTCLEIGHEHIPAIAEKVIESVRRAHEGGAEEDIFHLMMLVAAYRWSSSDYRETYRRMASEAEHWSEPLFLAAANYSFTERVFRNAVEGSVLYMSRISPEDRSDAAVRIDEAIRILETYGDVRLYASMLPTSYWIRGILKEDVEDKKLACYYAMYLSGLGLMSKEEADDVFARVFATEGKDSPLHAWYEELIEEFGPAA